MLEKSIPKEWNIFTYKNPTSSNCRYKKQLYFLIKGVNNGSLLPYRFFVLKKICLAPIQRPPLPWFSGIKPTSRISCFHPRFFFLPVFQACWKGYKQRKVYKERMNLLQRNVDSVIKVFISIYFTLAKPYIRQYCCCIRKLTELPFHSDPVSG